MLQHNAENLWFSKKRSATQIEAGTKESQAGFNGTMEGDSTSDCAMKRRCVTGAKPTYRQLMESVSIEKRYPETGQQFV
jgi:hypothetical protein